MLSYGRTENISAEKMQALIRLSLISGTLSEARTDYRRVGFSEEVIFS